jgi:hypothetical protein
MSKGVLDPKTWIDARTGCWRTGTTTTATPAGSVERSDQAVASVRVLSEVCGVTARVSLPVLGKEHLVRVVGPTKTSPTDITGTKAVTEATVSPSSSDIVNEAAHADSL